MLENTSHILNSSPKFLLDLASSVCMAYSNSEHGNGAIKNEVAAVVAVKMKELALELLDRKPAAPGGWNVITYENWNLPNIGQHVILYSNGGVQEDTYMLDQCDSDYGVGTYFWSREELDECPEVKPGDAWMPLPAAPGVKPLAVHDEYPMQPIIDGRFEKNPIVDMLVDNFNLNELSVWWQVNDIPQKYVEQIAQPIGYSIGGYSELSCVSDESVDSAVALSVSQKVKP